MDKDQSLFEGIGRGQLVRVVMGRLKIGVDLLEGIKVLARKEGIRTGVILSGIGALKRAVFRNIKMMPPDERVDDRYRLYLELDQPMELVSLPGWIATKEDGEVEVHAHFSVSTVKGEEVVTLGGHLIPGVITSIKVVVVIGVIEASNIKAGLDPRINQIDLKLPIQ